MLNGGASELRWDKWTGWRRVEPRWQVTVIDNTDEEPAATLDRLLDWITLHRQLLASGGLPLAAGWEAKG